LRTQALQEAVHEIGTRNRARDIANSSAIGMNAGRYNLKRISLVGASHVAGILAIETAHAFLITRQRHRDRRA
jgi:hypothetical protein